MKQPRFFCEFCGKEVHQATKICPHCGKFFSSIKCPRCNFVGLASSFNAGCPVCGYLKSQYAFQNVVEYKNYHKETPPLPLWIFLSSIAALLVTLGFLIFVFFQ